MMRCSSRYREADQTCRLTRLGRWHPEGLARRPLLAIPPNLADRRHLVGLVRLRALELLWHLLFQQALPDQWLPRDPWRPSRPEDRSLRLPRLHLSALRGRLHLALP